MSNHRNIQKKVWLLVVLFTLLNNCSASPIKYVWRLDRRIPNEIFKYGFQAWGSNSDIIQHVTGTSIENRTSNFVSTTGDENSNLPLAQGMFQVANPPRQLWLYQIRANHNFYNVRTTLETIQPNNPNYFLASMLLTLHGWQVEYAAQNNIDPSQVVSAVPVVELNGQAVIQNQEIESNPAYVDENTAANSEPDSVPSEGLIRSLWTSITRGFRGYPAGLGANCTKPPEKKYSALIQDDGCVLFQASYSDFFHSVNSNDNVFSIQGLQLNGLVRLVPNANSFIIIPYYLQN